MKLLQIPLRISFALTLFAFAWTSVQAQDRQMSLTAEADIDPTTAQAPELDSRGFTVLFDQTENTTTSGYLAFYDLDDAPNWVTQAAEDFVVPAGEIWDIESVYAGGFYLGLINPATSVNIFFYSNAGGDQPGVELYSFSGVEPDEDNDGLLTFFLDTPATLEPGTYWVSVQPEMDYFADGRWYWLGESAGSGVLWNWREGGSYGSGCTSWTPASGCYTDPQPGLSFALYGSIKTISTEGGSDGLTFDLSQNYPNPFSGTTTIAFELPHASHVTIEVLDVMGRRVALLVDDQMEATQHTVTWDASGVSSGVYMYRMIADGFSKTLRTTVVN